MIMSANDIINLSICSIRRRWYSDVNLLTLGYLDLDSPASVNLYAATFESKDMIEDSIAVYNEGVDELSKIEYTDYVGLMMSSVTSIINAIT